MRDTEFKDASLLHTYIPSIYKGEGRGSFLVERYIAV